MSSAQAPAGGGIVAVDIPASPEPGGSSVFTLVANPAPGGRQHNESIWKFLERSSEPIAVETRARWDAWLARMPAAERARLVGRLQDSRDEMVRSALAELVTFVLLDADYPGVQIEPPTGTGSRTDFAVEVPARTHFEVFRKAPPEAQTADALQLGRMIGELEKVNSPDFWLEVEAQTGSQTPPMRQVRAKVTEWLASLDYDEQVELRDQEQQARQARLAGEVPELDASPAERASYLAAHTPFQPPVFTDSGEGWSVRIRAHPRAQSERGPGQFTVGTRSAGAAHIATTHDLEKAVHTKLRQHTGLLDPLVVVQDLSSPIIGEREIAAALYGPVNTTMLAPDVPLVAVRDRTKGIWADPLQRPARPVAVLILHGIWLGCQQASATLWLPPGSSSPLLPGPWTVVGINADGQLGIVAAATGTAADQLNPGS
jgi:hypothetical protein